MSGGPEPSHVSMEELLGYAQHTLREERAVQIERHLADCAKCQRSFRKARLVASLSEPEAFRLPDVPKSDLERSAKARKRRPRFEALRCFLRRYP